MFWMSSWCVFFIFLKASFSFSLHRHWLTSTYILFAVPYFVYDIYAMFMCYWYKLRVKGHEEASAAPQHMSSALKSYLRREFLMVLHHVVMVTVCFPVSVVTVTHCSFCWAEIWVRRGKSIVLCNLLSEKEMSRWNQSTFKLFYLKKKMAEKIYHNTVGDSSFSIHQLIGQSLQLQNIVMN